MPPYCGDLSNITKPPLPPLDVLSLGALGFFFELTQIALKTFQAFSFSKTASDPYLVNTLFFCFRDMAA